MRSALLVATVATLALPTVAAAQPSATAPLSVEKSTSEPTNSINVSPLGLVFGNIALTYERLFNGTHGVIVEGYGSRSAGDSGSSLQMGGGVGYRWHWRGRQNSGFLGVMVAQSFGSGEVTQTINGAEMTHEMSVRSTTVTGNIGKRWMLNDALNITLRFGLGWGNHTAKAKQDTQEAKDAEETMNDILAFLPIGFDGELSLGYAF